jgi:hypothetical protein
MKTKLYAIPYCLAVFVIALVLGTSFAQAGPKPSIFFWWPGHWEQDLSRLYLEDGKTPQPGQWENDAWRPVDWVVGAGGAQAMMDALYREDIIRDRYEDDGLAVVKVGQGFMQLSGRDKRRVAAFVDAVCGYGTFELRHYRKETPLGLYTPYGLQLQ